MTTLTRASVMCVGQGAMPTLTGLDQLLLVAGAIFILLLGYYLISRKQPPGSGEPGGSVPEPVGSGGSWWQVTFTDPVGHNDPSDIAGSIPANLIGYINEARRTIHVAAFEFNLTPVAEALIAAHRRGVEVKWVTDDEHGIEADEEEDRGQFAMLEQAGIEVRHDQRSALMHNKFWIFDGQMVWTGSTNVTINGSFRNNNNVIVLRSSRVAQIYEREFEELWAGLSGPTSPSTVDQQSVTIDGTPVQILFASEDQAADHLVPMLQGAKKSIRFMAFSFTREDMGAALLAQANAGIDVKGIFETRGSATEYSQLPVLYCAGLPVRQDGNPGMLHHKVFVIDEQRVITGSLNFSHNADRNNDENVVVVVNPDIAALYLQEFDRRWAEARTPNRATMKCG